MASFNDNLPVPPSINGILDVTTVLGFNHAGGLPPRESLTSLAARARRGLIQPPPEIIHGLLHRGCKMLLGGTSKSCKSWTMLEAAMAVAGGALWWGFTTTKSKVLYINFELQDWSLMKRVKALGLEMGMEGRFSEPAMENIDVWNLRGHSTDVALLLPQLIESIKTDGYGLIIIDPLYKMLGATRDENDAASMGDVFNSLESLAQASGAAVMISHHYAKGNAAVKTPQDRVSGSGVMARDPDSLVMLTPHDEEDTYVVEFVLRHHAQPPPFCVKWVFPMMRKQESADPGDVRGHGGASKKLTANDVLSVIGERLIVKSQLCKELLEKYGVSRQTANRRVGELEDQGVLIYNNGFLKWKETK